ITGVQKGAEADLFGWTTEVASLSESK
ncbi:hypothetical protein, partial [Bacillus cereus]